MRRLRMLPGFTKWLGKLRDGRGRAAILARLAAIERHGHFGDHASVGDGLSELRLFTGPGYRVYYVDDGATVLLVMAGTKDSQARDIPAAKASVAAIRDDGEAP